MWAFVLCDQGKFDDSLDVLNKSKIYPHLNVDHPTLYNSILHQKIEIFIKQRRLEEAQKSLEEYEERIKTFFQGRYKKYLGLGSIWFFKSLLLMDKGKPNDKIIQYLSDALNLYNESFHGDKKHRYQARTHLALGMAHALNKDYTKALKAYLFSEEIYNAVFKDKNVDDVSELYTEFAILGAKLKDEALTQKYLTAHIEIFGLDHPRTEKILKYLDQAYMIGR